MKKVKTAVLGGGWFGNFHLDNLITMPEVEVCAVVTTNLEKLKLLQKKAPQAHAYTTVQDMVSKEPELDSLIACIPPDRHENVEALVASHGIHLYMEKPLGVDLSQVRKNEEAIQNSGIITSVGYQTRYNPYLDKLKEYLSTQNTGVVVAKWFGIMPPTPWWRVKAQSGGQLAEQVTHMVDMLRYLFGDIQSAFSTSRTGLIQNVPNYDVEDASTTIYTFNSGLIATVNCGCFVDGTTNNSEITIEFYSAQGQAEYVWDTSAKWGNKEQTTHYSFGNDFHYPALQTFIQAVQNKDSSLIRSPYSDGVKTFMATYAANESMQTGKVVQLSKL